MARYCAAVAGCIAVGVTITAGCTPGPLSHPTSGGAISNPVALGSDAASGPGAVETARRALQGTWTLTALELAPSPDAARVPVRATGTLVYDEFGNLTIDARTTDPAAPVAARESNLLSFKGRAVIDAPKSELKLMDLTGNVNPDEVLSPERRRRFQVNGDTLTLSSFDERGQVMSVATWRRKP
ncbi:MAG: hypothetical protein C5B57_09355 [Blastocatellia bacterium]|nr:MAG: hypothetical protein C5B57_09355 [Blastocatellia bacterium]